MPPSHTCCTCTVAKFQAQLNGKQWTRSRLVRCHWENGKAGAYRVSEVPGRLCLRLLLSGALIPLACSEWLRLGFLCRARRSLIIEPVGSVIFRGWKVIRGAVRRSADCLSMPRPLALTRCSWLLVMTMLGHCWEHHWRGLSHACTACVRVRSNSCCTLVATFIHRI